jgi:hypothetical protein
MNAKLHWEKVVERKGNIIGKFLSGKEPYLKKMGVDLIISHWDGFRSFDPTD